jgi:hypothetical protein
METKSCGSSSSKAIPSCKKDLLKTLPYFLKRKVFDFFGCKDFSQASRVCKYIQENWIHKIKNNLLPLYVPEDCKTIQEALTLVAPTYRRCDAIDLSVGTRVTARHVSGGGFLSGTVTRISTSALQSRLQYTIEFDNRNFAASRVATPIKDIRILKQPSNCLKFIKNIVLGKGEHIVEAGDEHGWKYLDINSPINILGKAGTLNNDIIVLGGFRINEKIQGNVCIQNITVKHLKRTGIWAASPFTLNNVIIEQSPMNGIVAWGKEGIGICTNIKVQHCANSGVSSNSGGSITLIGSRTSVQNNCQKNSFEPQFGLKVYGTCRSSIYLVHPLTKEIVSKNNNCHGNWGCHYTKAVLNKNIEEHIKTIKELNGKDHSEEKDQ